MKILEVLTKSGNVVSMSEGRRLVCLEAVRINGRIITDMQADIEPGDKVQVGKREPFIVD
jgi:ribosomal protein S4